MASMQILEGHTATVYALAFSPNGSAIASGGKDGQLVVRDGSGEHRFVAGHGGITTPIQAVGYRLTGELCFASEMHIGYYPIDDDWKADIDNQVGNSVWASPHFPLAFSSVNETTLAVGCGQRGKSEPGLFFLWDFSVRKRREPYFQEPAGVRAVATHPPSQLVAWANGSRRITVWDVTKPDQLHFNQSHNSQSLSFHPDGRLLAATADYNVRVYDIGKRHEIAFLKGHAGRVTSVAFSPDGRTLATGSWDETVRLWDVASGHETACFRWPVGKLYCLAYAPDGLRLAAGGDKGTIVVWYVG
jgi:WD40 repeat protein